MKKLVSLLLIFVIGIIVGIKVTILSIKVDAIDEIDEGIVTLEIFDQLHDYNY